jgi:hypothetical protein
MAIPAVGIPLTMVSNEGTWSQTDYGTPDQHNETFQNYLKMFENSRSSVVAVDERGNRVQGSEEKSLVIAEISPNDIKTSKGSVVRLNATLSHVANDDTYPRLTIVMPGNSMQSILIEDHAMSALSEDEVRRIVEEKVNAPGIIYTNDFVTYVPSTIVLDANETKIVEMIITIPPTWPDSLLGEPVNFSFTFDVLENEGGIGIQNDSVNVIVTPQEES